MEQVDSTGRRSFSMRGLSRSYRYYIETHRGKHSNWVSYRSFHSCYRTRSICGANYSFPELNPAHYTPSSHRPALISFLRVEDRHSCWRTIGPTRPYEYINDIRSSNLHTRSTQNHKHQCSTRRLQHTTRSHQQQTQPQLQRQLYLHTERPIPSNR